MKYFTEKRNCARCQIEIPAIYNYFNTDYSYPSKVINHSIEGLCLISDYYLKPGGCVYYRCDNRSTDTIKTIDCQCRHYRSLALAEVKWCKESVRDEKHFYMAGFKYYGFPY